MAERIDLNLLNVFDALMRERSVSRAAERLGIGQPAASAALARLRDLFGDELFVRAPGGVAPTSRASDAYPAIAQALDGIRQVVARQGPFEPAGESRTFRISGGDYIAMTLLPPLFAAVRAAAPGVDLRFRFVEKDAVPGLLEAGELDLALGVFPSARKVLQRRPLMRDRFVTLLRRDHPELKGDGADGLTLDGFCRLSHVLVTERGDEAGVVDAALAAVGRARRVVLTVPHLLTVPVLVAGGDSVVTVGERAARICARAFAGLTFLAPPVKLKDYEVSMMWARRRSGDAGLAWLCRTLQQVAEGAARTEARRWPRPHLRT